MVVTNDDKYAKIIDDHRLFGHTLPSEIYKKEFKIHDCSVLSLNFRMTDIQAAVGLVQLRKLDRYNEIRRRLAHYYTQKLMDIEGIVTPSEVNDVKHVYHLYNVLIDYT